MQNTREVHGEVPWFWFGVVTPVCASILRTKSSRNVTFTRPNFRSVPFFARPFSRASHHFAQPFLYVTFSLRDQIFAVLNFAIFSLREDKFVAKKWEFTVIRPLGSDSFREQECLRSLDCSRKSKSETFPLISLNRKKIKWF